MQIGRPMRFYHVTAHRQRRASLEASQGDPADRAGSALLRHLEGPTTRRHALAKRLATKL